MYDRTFHIDYGYDPKKKRCDRDSYVGLDIGGEVGANYVFIVIIIKLYYRLTVTHMRRQI